MFNTKTIFNLFTSLKKATKILGVTQAASAEQIKKAYYSLAKIYHPDNNNHGNSQQFMKLSEAYEVMMKHCQTVGERRTSNTTQFKENKTKKEKRDDEQLFGYYRKYKRTEEKEAVMDDFFKHFFDSTAKEFNKVNWMNYEQERQKSKRQEQKNKQRQQNNYQDQTFHNGAEEFHNEAETQDEPIRKRKRFVQNNKAQKEHPHYLQIKQNITITQQQAKTGINKTINITRRVICQSCKGSPTNIQIQCPKCKGTGMNVSALQTYYCWTCNGKKKINKPYCVECQGKGSVLEDVEETIWINAGIVNNQDIIYDGMGHQHRLAFYGNLNVKVKVMKKHWDSEGKQNYRRVGYDSYSKAKINIAQAVLGANLTYWTSFGKKTLLLPPGTQDSQIIKRPNEGLLKKCQQRQYGDHYITITLQIPTQITKQQQTIFEQLRKLKQTSSHS